jgi:FtsP/CotA-like multicopper oxidase with cupredoxin domain
VTLVVNGKETAALPIHILQQPQITAIEATKSADGTDLLKITGTGFGEGDAGHQLTVDGQKLGTAQIWKDTVIVGPNPAVANLKTGASVSLALYLHGDAAPSLSRTLSIT